MCVSVNGGSREEWWMKSKPVCWGQCLRSGPHGDLDLIHASDLLRGVLVRSPQESEGQSGVACEGQSGGLRRTHEGVPVAGRLPTLASTEGWGCCRITPALGEVADLCHLPPRSRCTFQALLKAFVKWRTVLSPGALEIQVQNICGICSRGGGGLHSACGAWGHLPSCKPVVKGLRKRQ